MSGIFYAGMDDYIYWLNLMADMVGTGEMLRLVDGVAAPSPEVGYAFVYVDIADGVTKVMHGDGTVVELEGGGSSTGDQGTIVMLAQVFS